jgi:hypothetical protein
VRLPGSARRRRRGRRRPGAPGVGRQRLSLVVATGGERARGGPENAVGVGGGRQRQGNGTRNTRAAAAI